jgi:hypothetical protein
MRGALQAEKPQASENGNGSVAGAILDNRSANQHSIHTQYENIKTACQVTGRLSLFYLPKLFSIRAYAQKKSGPDGIRTRICHLDRVPCYRYTTGPSKSSVRAGANERHRSQSDRPQCQVGTAHPQILASTLFLTPAGNVSHAVRNTNRGDRSLILIR